MSLIDDALRRAQAAQLPAERRGPGSRVPMPLPDPGRHRGRRIARTAAGTLAAALLAGAGVLLFRRSAERGVEPAGPAPAAAAGAAVATVATPLAETAVAPPPGPAKEFQAAMSAPPAANSHAGEAGQPLLAAPSAGAPAAMAPARETPRSPTPYRTTLLPPAEVPHASGSPRAAPEERPEERLREAEARRKSVRTFAGTALVPEGKIELGGIAYSDTSPTALINGQIVGPGSVVEGYTIVRIEPDRVELRDGGRTIYLTLK